MADLRLHLTLEEHKAIEREGQPWWTDRHIERALRGELLAQEIVSRLEGELNLLRCYVLALERHLARAVPDLALPPEVILERCLALGAALPAERRLMVVA